MIGSPAAIYPYPVSGRVGLIPSVTIALLLSVKRRAFSTTRRNSPVSMTNASDGVTTTLAFGCFFFIFQQA